jgi:hypothetical protein
VWFVLRERKFDAAAVDDLAALKRAAGLSDADVAEALRERASRVYAKFGSLMVNTSGMTASGIERKATCTALFQKMLYLSECEALLAQSGPEAAALDLRSVFGATEEDVDRLRIVSLVDVDIDKLDRMASGGDGDE